MTTGLPVDGVPCSPTSDEETRSDTFTTTFGLSSQDTAKGNYRKAANGFLSQPELPALVVRDDLVAELSLPEEALSYEPKAEIIIHKFKNGDKERKLHCNTELSEAEIAMLKQLQQMALSQSIVFFPSVSVAATRYLSRARGDVKKAFDMMKATQAWRANYFKSGPIDAEKLKPDLDLGIVYFAGRDKELRPTLVCRANRIPAAWFKEKQVDRLLTIAIFCMEYMVRYMCMPGKVEGLNLIVDLKGLSASQIPISELKKLMELTSHHYSGRAFRLYICNLSYFLNVIASAVKAVMTDRQRQKIVMIGKMEEFREDFALHQLETDYGGTRPTITQFFPFPLEAGPFDAGTSKGPKQNPVKRLDMILTPQNCFGKLWDTKKSKEDNLLHIRFDYPLSAVPLFEQCGLPLPELLAQKEERSKAKERAKSNASLTARSKTLESGQASNVEASMGVGAVVDFDIPGVPGDPSKEDVEEEEAQEEFLDYAFKEEEPDLNEAEVTPTSWFSCTPCKVCENKSVEVIPAPRKVSFT